MDEELREAAVKLCRAASYSGVGSVEFLLEPESGWFEFVQFTTGLQLEHPVTEVTTGLDLVKLQLQLALGLSLHGGPPATWGHAVGAVVCAEDPEQGFAAAAGRIALFRPPAGAGIRVDTGVAEGDVTSGGYSSPIAKIIAWGRDRQEALDRLERALAQCAVIVEGGTTNRSFLLSLLGQPELRRATFDHRWLERLVEIDGHVPPLDPVALLHAAVEAYDTEHATAQSWFYATAARGRPETPRSIGQRVELRYRGAAYPLTVFRLGPGDYRIDTGHGSADVHVDRYGPFESHLTCGERTYHVLSAASGPDRLVEVDGVAHSVSREGEGAVRASGPAFVIDVLVERGDEVGQGDPLVRLETMKMESVVRAPFPGTVRAVEVTGNMQVEAGAPLVVLRPVERPSGRSWTSEPVDLSAICVDGDGDEPPYQRLRPYLLGYDLDESSVRRLLEEYRKFRASRPVSRALDPEEEDALGLFVDIGLLFRPAPDVADNVQGDEPPEESSPSTQEHLLTYLAFLDPDRSRLPGGYRRRLRRALARYGVDSLERTPALEEALLWMFRSLRRFEETAEVVTTILQSRLLAAAATAGADVASDGQLGGQPGGQPGGDRVADSAAAQQLRALLLRVAGAAELRQQTVADLARELRFRYFEEPVLEQAFRAVYTEIDRLLDALRDDPAAPGRADWMEQVESCPQPLRARLRQRYQSADVPYRKVLLELHLRRYYTIRALHGLVADGGDDGDGDGSLLCSADFEHEQKRVHVLVAYTPLDKMTEVAAAIARHAERVEPDRLLVVDLVTWRGGAPEEAESMAADLQDRLTRCDFGRELHRLDIAVTSEGLVAENYRSFHFTYRQHAGVFTEELLYRNLHPMLAKRLELWHLSEFSLERLASVEDVYLFRGVAHDNPDDERLFAVAEVRDLTPVRDESGRVVALPHLERMTLQALAAMRTALAHLPTKVRPLRNRVMLHVRPTWDLPPALWQDIAHWLAPLTVGIGLERVVAQGRMSEPGATEPREVVVEVENVSEQGVSVRVHPPDDERVRPLTAYGQKVLRSQRIGTVYPYELLRLLTMPQGTVADLPPGRFVEHDLDEDNRLVPVERPDGHNSAHVVVGVLTNFTTKVPEGMARVVILGDPTKSLGSVAEPECRRICAALDLAEQMSVPVEWFALSAGARIAMDSGTENMDWVAAALRRLIEFTQAGGEVNVVVAGINVGAQPLLERRGDDAHAHPRHPRHDAHERHGAHRQAGARLRRRGVGRGQLRHRWLRPSDGAERPGAVLGTEPVGGLPGAPAALRPHLRGPGRAGPEAGAHRRPRRPGRLDVAARQGRGHRFRMGGGDLLRPPQSGPAQGLRHPFGHEGRERSGPRAARALGEVGQRRECGRVGCARRRHACLPAGRGVEAVAAAPFRAGGRSAVVDRGHAVPPVVPQDRPGPERREREQAGGRAGEPVRFRWVAGVDAPLAAGVRRRDRACRHELPGPHRLRRHLPLSRGCLRSLLETTQSPPRDRRPRGIPRVGHRRRSRRCDGVRPRGREARGGRSPHRRAPGRAGGSPRW